MATASQARSHELAEMATVRRSRMSFERLLSPLLLAPSMAAIAVFVYLFIAFSAWVSVSEWGTNTRNLTLSNPLFKTYMNMFGQTRWQDDLRNSFIFTVLFLAMSVLAGLFLAILLDQRVPMSGFIRSVILFPYALSFITTGVAWRWIFNPQTGVNQLFEDLGVNALLAHFGTGPIHPAWITDPRVVWQINEPLSRVLPFVADWHVKLGIPMAMIPVTIAAAWQLSGFAMAMYLAGLGTIPTELKEASALDGATAWQTYRRIVIPMLKPITISVLVILTHVSLKIFDLIFAMVGKGPGFATDVPGIYVFDKMFGAQQYNLGSAASIVMLVAVAIVIVPYLARQLKEL
jgi:glucose/mannose transport system permease protein